MDGLGGYHAAAPRIPGNLVKACRACRGTLCNKVDGAQRSNFFCSSWSVVKFNADMLADYTLTLAILLIVLDKCSVCFGARPSGRYVQLRLLGSCPTSTLSW